VHVLGQAPRRDAPAPAEPRSAVPSDVPQQGSGAPSRKISVRVEVDEPAVEDAPAAAASVQGTTAAPSTPAPDPEEQAIRKRRSKYAKMGDEEYAEGVELAKSISAKLDQTREKLAQLTQEANQPLTPDVMDEVRAEVDQIAVDDELARRIARLSKPTEPEDRSDSPDEPLRK